MKNKSILIAALLVLLGFLKLMHKSILEKGHWEPCKKRSSRI
jgi:hypothetical protein